MAAPGIFEMIGGSIQNALDAFLTSTISNFVDFATTIAGLGVVIYFTLMGLLIMAGRVEAPMNDFLLKAVKINLIAVFALSAPFYTTHVAGSINDLEAKMTSGFASMSSPAATCPSSNIYQTLDCSFAKGMKISSDAIGEASKRSWYDLGEIVLWWCVGIVIALCICALVLAGGITILIAKFLLTLVLAIGPLFIMLMMFPVTKQFFDRWFAQAMTYVLTIVMTGAVVALALLIFENQTKTADITNVAVKSPIQVAAEIALITAILIAITKQTASLASSLAGGMASSALSAGAVVAGAIGGALAAKRLLSGNKQGDNGGKGDERQNIVTDENGKQQLGGHGVSSSCVGHIMAGRTLANPRYCAAALRRAGSNVRSAAQTAAQNWVSPPNTSGGKVTPA